MAHIQVAITSYFDCKVVAFMADHILATLVVASFGLVLHSLEPLVALASSVAVHHNPLVAVASSMVNHHILVPNCLDTAVHCSLQQQRQPLPRLRLLLRRILLRRILLRLHFLLHWFILHICP